VPFTSQGVVPSQINCSLRLKQPQNLIIKRVKYFFKQGSSNGDHNNLVFSIRKKQWRIAF